MAVITYREMAPAELPGRAAEIDVSEHGTVVYTWIDGELRAVPEAWDRPRWTAETWQQEKWSTVLSLAGVRVWGAFHQEQLVGLVVYRPRLITGMAQLAALFVSKDYRRQGIAARLAGEVGRQAKRDGHARLYVSATPSESAVCFYQGQGFVPTQDTNAELYELEPEDIHMVKEL
jgi:GNAT superfamily N-acetyltransferase